MSAQMIRAKKLPIKKHLNQTRRQHKCMVHPACCDEIEVSSVLDRIIEETTTCTDANSVDQVLSQNRPTTIVAGEVDIDIRVLTVFDADRCIFIMRVQVLVNPTAAALLCVPERDREAAIAGVVEVWDRVIVSIGVKMSTGEICVDITVCYCIVSRPRCISSRGRRVAEKHYKCIASALVASLCKNAWQGVLPTLEEALHL